MQNEKMQIIGGIFLMFSQGKITKEELDKVTAIFSASKPSEFFNSVAFACLKEYAEA